ncbi:MAG TPA: dienelactone hydrolase family protein [Anaerolineales bacterium]|nr:dienelactone hydrolase family protein [Anaerolineales bacterium]
MNLFQRYLAEEFAEDYEEGRLSRRDALKLIASVTGSLVVANSILTACTPPEESTATSAPASTEPPTAQSLASPEASATAESAATEPAATSSSSAAYGTVMPDDPAVTASEVQIPAPDTEILGYLAHPSSGDAAPVILICHENRGLTPHIQDVTRRFAKAGYVALAVDLLSRQGGSTAVGQENVPGALGNISPDQFVEDFKSGWEYLKGQSFADAARVGMTGFCFGGGVTWRVATQMPELLAAVPFYGPHPPLEDVPNIQAAVLAIYGELDSRINSGIPAIEQAMMENNKIYEKIIYQGADHAFHNDTGSRYNAEAARDAWQQTLAWFERYVRSA